MQVVGCNYDIGLSIVSANRLDHYLLCFNGHYSPQVQKHEVTESGSYDKVFLKAVKMVKSGVMDLEELTAYIDELGSELSSSNPTVDSCSYI